MRRVLELTLVVHAVLAAGWLVRATPASSAPWQAIREVLAAKEIQFSRMVDVTEMPAPWSPTRIAIRAEDGALYLEVFGSLDAPESWRPHGPPVVYVYPDADVTVGDVVAALDKVEDLAPKGTLVVTELR